GLCLSRTNYDVEIEHVFIKLCETPNTDLARILRYFEIDLSRLSADLMRALDRLKTGNARTPALSPQLPKLIESAWLLASVEYDAPRIRSGHLTLALLGDENLSRIAREISPEFARISVETLSKHMADLTSGSVEDKSSPASGAKAQSGGQSPPPGAKAPTKPLDQLTIDRPAGARKGEIDLSFGRHFKIPQTVDPLTRPPQNKPPLTGEGGVGKTAVV